ncbi:MAG: hypothetical protein SGI77_18215 [Pirellulaceae bacterium]|nr:hypothetical protein [Pirellulaceae bacterium]
MTFKQKLLQVGICFFIDSRENTSDVRLGFRSVVVFYQAKILGEMLRTYAVGDLVVYTQKKQSPMPGPRAKNINPSQRGELYSYQVDKFWMVAETNSSDELVLKTRRGKAHLVKTDDVRLRKARWWERFFLKARFPTVESLASNSSITSQN